MSNKKDDLSQDELWRLRSMVSKAGWAKFMSHVGSLMAEQADNVPQDSEQDKWLFRCSNLIHSKDLSEAFQKCGKFDYKQFPFTPKEYKPYFEE